MQPWIVHFMALRAHDIKDISWDIPRSGVCHKKRCPNLGVSRYGEQKANDAVPST